VIAAIVVVALIAYFASLWWDRRAAFARERRSGLAKAKYLESIDVNADEKKAMK
jgi:hypothetical protein